MFDMSDKQRLISSSKEIIDYLIKNNVIIFGSFIGKSGEKYSIETDIRKAFKKQAMAYETTEKIFNILDKNGFGDLPFLGVPETGTLLANYLNNIMYLKTQKDFSPNMLRASPKVYQSDTDSVLTVLPIVRDQEYSLIEDDVVTGNTLIKYLESALSVGVRIKNVIIVFARSSANAVFEFCENKKINYFEIISIK